jgi:hypothetical protein
MRSNVLPKDEEIKENDCGKDLQPCRTLDDVQYPDAMRLSPNGDSNGREKWKKPKYQRIDGDEGQIADRSPRPRLCQLPAWKERLQQAHHDEDRDERSQTNDRLLLSNHAISYLY